MAAPMIRIIVKENSLRRGSFEMALEDGTNLGMSSQPLLDAARILLDQGISPDEAITIRHAGSPHDSLTSTVSAAARLTVREDKNGPRFVEWRPFVRGSLTREPNDQDPS